jgi:hypothetical protein
MTLDQKWEPHGNGNGHYMAVVAGSYAIPWEERNVAWRMVDLFDFSGKI